MIARSIVRKPRHAAIAGAVALILGLGPGLAAADLESTVQFDISAQQLPSALLKYSEQSGVQITAPDEVVAGKASTRVRGTFPARGALDRLLMGTELSYEEIDPNTVLIRHRRDAARSLMQESTANPAAGSFPSVQPGSSVQEIIVVGSRIGDAPPTGPVITLTREDIDRSGAVTAADTLRLIPQNFSGVSGSTALATGGNIGFTAQADIRGLGPQATLTLINGRRISAAAGDAGRAVDIGMIPSAAIERVEVLTDSASALYGSDAIGGVVNFVLREQYEGARSQGALRGRAAIRRCGHAEFQCRRTLDLSAAHEVVRARGG